jgi:hypothetical protein
MLGGYQTTLSALFCTTMHRFAQSFDQNLIDVLERNFYRARQIEPGSLKTLRLSFEDAAAQRRFASLD